MLAEHSWARNSPEYLAFVSYSMMQAVRELHAAGLVHGDIKLANFFTTELFDVFLADYAPWKPSEVSDMTPTHLSYFFTGSYLAPERQVMRYTGAPTLPSKEADVFSLGCCLVELWSGESPFTARNISAYKRGEGDFDFLALEKKIMAIEHSGVRDLVRIMINASPENRVDIIKLEWHTVFLPEECHMYAIIDRLKLCNGGNNNNVPQLVSCAFETLKELLLQKDEPSLSGCSCYFCRCKAGDPSAHAGDADAAGDLQVHDFKHQENHNAPRLFSNMLMDKLPSPFNARVISSCNDFARRLFSNQLNSAESGCSCSQSFMASCDALQVSKLTFEHVLWENQVQPLLRTILIFGPAKCLLLHCAFVLSVLIEGNKLELRSSLQTATCLLCEILTFLEDSCVVSLGLLPLYSVYSSGYVFHGSTALKHPSAEGSKCVRLHDLCILQALLYALELLTVMQPEYFYLPLLIVEELALSADDFGTLLHSLRKIRACSTTEVANIFRIGDNVPKQSTGNVYKFPLRIIAQVFYPLLVSVARLADGNTKIRAVIETTVLHNAGSAISSILSLTYVDNNTSATSSIASLLQPIVHLSLLLPAAVPVVTNAFRTHLKYIVSADAVERRLGLSGIEGMISSLLVLLSTSTNRSEWESGRARVHDSPRAELTMSGSVDSLASRTGLLKLLKDFVFIYLRMPAFGSLGIFECILECFPRFDESLRRLVLFRMSQVLLLPTFEASASQVLYPGDYVQQRLLTIMARILRGSLDTSGTLSERTVLYLSEFNSVLSCCLRTNLLNTVLISLVMFSQSFSKHVYYTAHFTGEYSGDIFCPVIHIRKPISKHLARSQAALLELVSSLLREYEIEMGDALKERVDVFLDKSTASSACLPLDYLMTDFSNIPLMLKNIGDRLSSYQSIAIRIHYAIDQYCKQNEESNNGSSDAFGMSVIPSLTFPAENCSDFSPTVVFTPMLADLVAPDNTCGLQEIALVPQLPPTVRNALSVERTYVNYTPCGHSYSSTINYPLAVILAAKAFLSSSLAAPLTADASMVTTTAAALQPHDFRGRHISDFKRLTVLYTGNSRVNLPFDGPYPALIPYVLGYKLSHLVRVNPGMYPLANRDILSEMIISGFAAATGKRPQGGVPSDVLTLCSLENNCCADKFEYMLDQALKDLNITKVSLELLRPVFLQSPLHFASLLYRLGLPDSVSVFLSSPMALLATPTITAAATAIRQLTGCKTLRSTSSGDILLSSPTLHGLQSSNPVYRNFSYASLHTSGFMMCVSITHHVFKTQYRIFLSPTGSTARFLADQCHVLSSNAASDATSVLITAQPVSKTVSSVSGSAVHEGGSSGKEGHPSRQQLKGQESPAASAGGMKDSLRPDPVMLSAAKQKNNVLVNALSQAMPIASFTASLSQSITGQLSIVRSVVFMPANNLFLVLDSNSVLHAYVSPYIDRVRYICSKILSFSSSISLSVNAEADYYSQHELSRAGLENNISPHNMRFHPSCATTVPAIDAQDFLLYVRSGMAEAPVCSWPLGMAFNSVTKITLLSSQQDSARLLLTVTDVAFSDTLRGTSCTKFVTLTINTRMLIYQYINSCLQKVGKVSQVSSDNFILNCGGSFVNVNCDMSTRDPTASRQSVDLEVEPGINAFVKHAAKTYFGAVVAKSGTNLSIKQIEESSHQHTVPVEVSTASQSVSSKKNHTTPRVSHHVILQAVEDLSPSLLAMLVAITHGAQLQGNGKESTVVDPLLSQLLAKHAKVSLPTTSFGPYPTLLRRLEFLHATLHAIPPTARSRVVLHDSLVHVHEIVSPQLWTDSVLASIVIPSGYLSTGTHIITFMPGSAHLYAHDLRLLCSVELDTKRFGRSCTVSEEFVVLPSIHNAENSELNNSLAFCLCTCESYIMILHVHAVSGSHGASYTISVQTNYVIADIGSNGRKHITGVLLFGNTSLHGSLCRSIAAESTNESSKKSFLGLKRRATHSLSSSDMGAHRAVKAMPLSGKHTDSGTATDVFALETEEANQASLSSLFAVVAFGSTVVVFSLDGDHFRRGPVMLTTFQVTEPYALDNTCAKALRSITCTALCYEKSCGKLYLGLSDGSILLCNMISKITRPSLITQHSHTITRSGWLWEARHLIGSPIFPIQKLGVSISMDYGLRSSFTTERVLLSDTKLCSANHDPIVSMMVVDGCLVATTFRGRTTFYK